MAEGGDISTSDTTPELYDLMRSVEKIRVIDESDKVALHHIITKISDVTSFRTERLDYARRRLARPLRYLIVFMSTVLVVRIVIIGVTDIFVHLFMAISTITAVYLLYAILMELDSPLVGVWRISSLPFEQMLKSLDNKRKLTESKKC